MILNCDKEGESVIQQLCNLALKQGGLSNLNQVNLTLRSIKILPEPEEVPKENSIKETND